MTRLVHRTLIAVLATSATSAACAHARRELSPSGAAEVQAGVSQTLALLQRYWAARQWDSLVTLYADDARFRWIENGQVRYRSRAAIRSGLSSLPPGMRLETTYRDTEITAISPDIASLATRFETRMTDSASARGFTFGGAITMTLIKQSGAWRILEGHTSAPVERPR